LTVFPILRVIALNPASQPRRYRFQRTPLRSDCGWANGCGRVSRFAICCAAEALIQIYAPADFDGSEQGSSDALHHRDLYDRFEDFGRMPIANGFLRPEQIADEFFFDLKVGFCPSCKMVQLTELVDPDKLFHDDYAYFSSISTRMAEHFRQFAGWVGTNYLAAADSLVIEVGSNDGIMLQNFSKAGVRHVGVEPSANVAEAARDQGINTLCEFFNEETAGQICDEYGQADAVLGTNVICHIPDLHSIFSGPNVLLKPAGVFVFEVPYLGDIVEKTSYDQIYDAHVFCFSLHSVSALARQHGMELIDALPQSVHGGSMRYVIARQGSHRPTVSVVEILNREIDAGLNDAATFDRLSDRINASRDALVRLLKELKGQGKRVAGYGAPSKSTTVTNFCGIGPDIIEFISDTTPGKQGKLSPGVHIPVVPYDRFTKSRPDVALLFA
jgi:methylation protein EvaC